MPDGRGLWTSARNAGDRTRELRMGGTLPLTMGKRLELKDKATRYRLDIDYGQEPIPWISPEDGNPSPRV